jgi:hypothetical protein
MTSEASRSGKWLGASFLIGRLIAFGNSSRVFSRATRPTFSSGQTAAKLVDFAIEKGHMLLDQPS